jgi:SAM-dependent methyltransferase
MTHHSDEPRTGATSDVRRHYQELLAPIYAWSVAAAGDPFARAGAWLARLRLDDGASYLDLGAGFGAHAAVLARLGKRVTAVDVDPTLVAELRVALGEHAAGATVVEDDLIAFVAGAGDARWDVIMCLGDTLTHLTTTADVARLLEGCARHLGPGGRLVLSYRDSTRLADVGVARFREVARDARRTMHCLLEPIDDLHLRVTDLVTEVLPDGPRTRISDYVKLRLAPGRVAAWASAAGLTLAAEDEERGMTSQIFTAPG